MPNPIQLRLADLSWASPTSFTLQGLDFVLVDVGAAKPPPPTLTLKKPAAFLPTYAEVIGEAPTRNVLELGVAHGGSALLFAAILAPVRLVSVDI